MGSDAFHRNNPRYVSAGDFRYDLRRNQMDLRPLREKPLPPGSNLDVLKIMNERGLSRDEAEYAAADARSRGMRTAFGSANLEPNRNLNQRERLRLGLDKGQSSAPTGPTDDQRKWAKAFREKSAPQKSSAPAPSGGGSLLGAAARTFKTVAGMPSAATAPKEPLNFSRSALVEGAKQTGDFKKIREGFDTQSKQAGTGMRMNDLGVATPISKTKVGADGLTPFARERFGPAMEEKAAARDFATNKSTATSGTTGMVKQDGGARPTQAMDFSRTITSKYGGGTNVSRAPGQQGGGMMPDPLTGKMVPMKNALAEQSAVQDTKFGPNAGKAGEGYFDPKAIRQSMQQKRGRV